MLECDSTTRPITCAVVAALCAGIVTAQGGTDGFSTFADFEADKARIAYGEQVQFFDRSTTSIPGGIVFWSWDLDGDGGFGDSTLQDPTWTYTTCGSHDVSLIASSAYGGDVTTKYGFIDVVGPTASFTFELLDTTPPIDVQLTSTSTDLGTSASFDWDLDGDSVFELTNAGPVVIGAYAAAALYPNVGLRVTDGCGSDTATETVDTRILWNDLGGGGGCTPTRPVALGNGDLALGPTVTLSLTDAAPGASIVLWIGTQPASELPLGAMPPVICPPYDWTFPVSPIIAAPSASAGGEFSFSFPNSAGLAGIAPRVQFATLGTTGFYMSNVVGWPPGP